MDNKNQNTGPTDSVAPQIVTPLTPAQDIANNPPQQPVINEHVEQTPVNDVPALTHEATPSVEAPKIALQQSETMPPLNPTTGIFVGGDVGPTARSSRKFPVLIIVGLVGITVLGGGMYAFMQQKDANKKADTTQVDHHPAEDSSSSAAAGSPVALVKEFLQAYQDKDKVKTNSLTDKTMLEMMSMSAAKPADNFYDACVADPFCDTMFAATKPSTVPDKTSEETQNGKTYKTILITQESSDSKSSGKSDLKFYVDEKAMKISGFEVSLAGSASSSP